MIDLLRKHESMHWKENVRWWPFVLLFVGPILCLFFLSYVWPTAYRYGLVDIGRIRPTIEVRQNRFTGTVEVHTINGWKYVDRERGKKLMEIAR